MPVQSVSMARRSTKRSRQSSNPASAGLAGPRNVRDDLNGRVRRMLGRARTPRSVEAVPVLLDAIRQSLPRQSALDMLVPELRLYPPAAVASQGASVYQREHAATLYRLLRMIWLAEMVFGDKMLAMDWLSEPKARLYGHPPALQMRDARDTGAVERWLLDIEEGNGP